MKQLKAKSNRYSRGQKAKPFFQPLAQLGVIQRKKHRNAQQSQSKTKRNLKAQKALWDDIHSFFPDEGRKLAGSGYDSTVSTLQTSFREGTQGGTSYSAPIVNVGKDYMKEKDPDLRKSWIERELKKINKWRVANGRIDNMDLHDSSIKQMIDELDSQSKRDLHQKMEGLKKYIKNDKMRDFVWSRIASTPRAAGATERLDGGFEFQFQNVKIIVMPDVHNSNVPASDAAETKIESSTQLNFPIPGGTWDRHSIVDSITSNPTIPQLTYRIETHYGPDSGPTKQSGYGVGTRIGDAGEQKTLRFHEGTHGSVFIREVKNNIAAHPFPTWQGRLRQTRSVFEGHVATYRAGVNAFNAMIKSAVDASVQQVDCVGQKTIVQYHQQKGTTTTVSCSP